jgi:nucleoside-diphosphate-sugar epimerase
MKLAVLGASGFIGGRVVEMLHLRRTAAVRPVARRVSGLARSARFDLDCRIADAFDRAALQSAFEGCEVVLHAVAGDARTILGSLAPVYQAAQAAGVQRLVYLSSASVHGPAPPPGTDERTPLTTDHALPYSNARVRAERDLMRLRHAGGMELVLLRPGIVWGPRSRWTAGLADDLLAGEAYLVGAGAGISNAVYVDNLVHAIELAATAPVSAVDREAFLVGDRERITWADLYSPIARALGVDLGDIPKLYGDVRRPSGRDWWQRVHTARDTRPVRALLSLFPERLRYAVYSGLAAWHGFQRQPAGQTGKSSEPNATVEMTLLQSCQYQLPSARAREVLGYDPPVSFSEACRRSVGWLSFAGYPVVESAGEPEARVAHLTVPGDIA